MIVFSNNILDKVKILINLCKDKNIKIITAESCTGGLLSAAFTEISGASKVFEQGFITYSNNSKTKLLGVPSGLIEKHGAVSNEVAFAMAEGAIKTINKNSNCSSSALNGTHQKANVSNCNDALFAMQGHDTPLPYFISVSITGIADSNDEYTSKTTGLVYIGITDTKSKNTQIEKNIFSGNRTNIRLQAIKIAINIIINRVESI